MCTSLTSLSRIVTTPKIKATIRRKKRLGTESDPIPFVKIGPAKSVTVRIAIASNLDNFLLKTLPVGSLSYPMQPTQTTTNPVTTMAAKSNSQSRIDLAMLQPNGTELSAQDDERDVYVDLVQLLDNVC
jgi:hypothetical protein